MLRPLRLDVAGMRLLFCSGCTPAYIVDASVSAHNFQATAHDTAPVITSMSAVLASGIRNGSRCMGAATTLQQKCIVGQTVLSNPCQNHINVMTAGPIGLRAVILLYEACTAADGGGRAGGRER